MCSHEATTQFFLWLVAKKASSAPWHEPSPLLPNTFIESQSKIYLCPNFLKYRLPMVPITLLTETERPIAALFVLPWQLCISAKFIVVFRPHLLQSGPADSDHITASSWLFSGSFCLMPSRSSLSPLTFSSFSFQRHSMPPIWWSCSAPLFTQTWFWWWHLYLP